jgi:hypothetical protein
MPRVFNTTGPCEPARHYMLPPVARLSDLMTFVDQQLYFVLHAARQTGKTTAMRAFAEELRGIGILGLWVTLEESRGVSEVEVAEPRWIDAIESSGRRLPPGQRPPPLAAVSARPMGSRLRAYLQLWCEQVFPTPVVLLLDEADTLVGPALINLLSQLRAGFMDRGPGNFPVSMALIGMRDLRDYLTAAKGGHGLNPGSPFNIKAESITLRDFTEPEVVELLHQHSAETGQPFLADAVSRIWHWGRGQPFLTNALARLLTQTLVPDRSVPIAAAEVERAKEHLIASRTTHLDSLSHRIREDRLARVLQPILLGDHKLDYQDDDFSYAMDLGLVRRGLDGAEISNPLYREVLVRELTYNTQENLARPWWPWARPSGGIDLAALSRAFVEWWRENADTVERQAHRGYLEAVPHIALMAFLQRVVNGGGSITREYAAGRGRVDLLVDYAGERHAIELKRVFDGGRPMERVKADGLAQLSGYLDTLGLEEGWLWIFDQRAGRSWEQRVWEEELLVDGKRLHLRGA